MVAPWKVEYVERLNNTIKDAKVFAIANVIDIPSSSMQRIRKSIKDKGVEIKIVRKRLLLRALKDIAKEKEGIKKIADLLDKEKRITVALIIPKNTDMNPFKLYKIFDENKSYRAARVGDIAPNDIVIPSGPTQFTPGPILSVLKKFGLKTKVEGGKIVITEDAVVARKGDEISYDLADLLSKFGIEPIEVKIRILYAYDNGLIYTEDILSIPPEKYIEDLKTAILYSIKLGKKLGIPTKDTIKLLLKDAIKHVITLSIKTGFVTKDNIELLLRKSISEAMALSTYLPEEYRPINVKSQEETQQPTEEKKEPKQGEDKEEDVSVLGSFF